MISALSRRQLLSGNNILCIIKIASMEIPVEAIFMRDSSFCRLIRIYSLTSFCASGIRISFRRNSNNPLSCSSLSAFDVFNRVSSK